MKQLEMPFLQFVADTKNLNLQWISLCNKEADSVALCWNKRTVKYGVRDAALKLEISYSHLSNIINGKKYFPNDLRIKFQILCGNWAIRQYEDMQICATTEFVTPEKIENQILRARIEQLEKVA